MRKVFCPKLGIDFKRHLLYLKKEFFRKTIHLGTAFVPILLHFYRNPILILLACAGVLYIIAEFLRYKGHEIPLISDITAAAARKRDENRFVLGPVTLVAGVLTAALLWEEKASAVGILALAFGDGLASLAGKTFGQITVPLTHGKTAEGSLTCFAAIFLSSFVVCQNTMVSLTVASVGMLIEVLPLKDFDNLLIPILLGGIAEFLLPHI